MDCRNSLSIISYWIQWFLSRNFNHVSNFTQNFAFEVFSLEVQLTELNYHVTVGKTLNVSLTTKLVVPTLQRTLSTTLKYRSTGKHSWPPWIFRCPRFPDHQSLVILTFKTKIHGQLIYRFNHAQWQHNYGVTRWFSHIRNRRYSEIKFTSRVERTSNRLLIGVRVFAVQKPMDFAVAVGWKLVCNTGGNICTIGDSSYVVNCCHGGDVFVKSHYNFMFFSADFIWTLLNLS